MLVRLSEPPIIDSIDEQAARSAPINSSVARAMLRFTVNSFGGMVAADFAFLSSEASRCALAYAQAGSNRNDARIRKLPTLVIQFGSAQYPLEPS